MNGRLSADLFRRSWRPTGCRAIFASSPEGIDVIFGILGRARRLAHRIAFRFRMVALDRHRARLRPGEQRTFLFWVPGGMPLMLDVEAALAVAVKLRGHRVHAVMCDGVASACVRRE